MFVLTRKKSHLIDTLQITEQSYNQIVEIIGFEHNSRRSCIQIKIKQSLACQATEFNSLYKQCAFLGFRTISITQKATCRAMQTTVSNCMFIKVNWLKLVFSRPVWYSVGPRVHVPPLKSLIEHFTIIWLKLVFTVTHSTGKPGSNRCAPKLRILWKSAIISELQFKEETILQTQIVMQLLWKFEMFISITVYYQEFIITSHYNIKQRKAQISIKEILK